MTERLTRSQQRERTVQRLLDSAEELFAERGIHQTSLDQVAAAAGLTKGAVYANFGGKNDLIAALLQRRLEDDGPVREPGSLRSWIDMLGDSYESSVPRPETRRFAMAFVELWLIGMRDQGHRDALRTWLRTVREHHAREVRALGDDLPLPPAEAAALLMALDIGIGLQFMTDPEAVPAQTYTRGVEALLGVRRAGGSVPR
ncbi:TetR/AcrR family transcriptional regulator [Couchioplanes caeruleus]|uniref:TetR/AcrR family transcriptional regulator n=1 Tax=Couchioplanes caeruleus TaxID=56438 RepID=UPI0020BF14DC|nr:TetR/AcrR family transcriptional regulator [Couchioplanes caeruleus]UQU66161.1 TetR/AcrR family transcriptional regulator [Couchioplanes caeruleus]